MSFVRYMHVERFGTGEVDGIECGKVYVFPKIDGTNGSVWKGEDGTIQAASRNRVLSLKNDNAGFLAYVLKNEKLIAYIEKHPTHRIYGEWLVPHSLKTYREDAWRKFYIFDIVSNAWDDEKITHVHMEYDVYQPLLDEFELDYIAPIAIINDSHYDQFIKQLEKNTFLIEDGKGTGEGIVLKNYSFYNRYGRQTWAKIVKSEFKELHGKVMGVNELKGPNDTVPSIVSQYCTSALIEKTYAKIVNDSDGAWSSKMIPHLFSRIYHDLIQEEIWNILKKFKNPKIDFRYLNTCVIQKIKEVKPEIFS